jgi:PIN domain nuclease of toxin-antitoxin system
LNQSVLDACALLALLRNETGADIVADAINEANYKTKLLSMHKANMFEVYYDIFRIAEKTIADKVIAKVKKSPIQIIPDISDCLFEEMGRLKPLYKISFADTFALATASINKAQLITADHHEMDIIEQNEPNIKFLWIR